MKSRTIISTIQNWENKIAAQYPIKTLLTVFAIVCFIIISFQIGELKWKMTSSSHNDGEQMVEIQKNLSLMQSGMYFLQADISVTKRDVSSMKTDISTIKKRISANPDQQLRL